MKALWMLLLASVLCACTSHRGSDEVVVPVAAQPARLTVQAEGELQSAKPTPLSVPGQQWSRRQLAWMVPDGSFVKRGDVVARFSAEQSKLQLSDALIDLQRNALARAAKQDELGASQGQLQVDMTQVTGQLAIAHRYANASEQALARDTILDAVLDEHFLNVKRNTLDWREHTASQRGKAELALISAQRATSALQAKQKREDLDALDLRAPHDGLLVLKADWGGRKPRVGSAMWAGNTFADLPDISDMQVQIYLPQSQSQSIKPGLAVELAPLGAPDQRARSTISWVAAAAATRRHDSPVKYLSMKASVPADAVRHYRWAPGQRFVARIVLLDVETAITVPNIAIDSSGDQASVQVHDGGRDVRRRIELGVRGPSRSQVLKGLRPGDRIVLNPPADSSSAAAHSGAAAKPAKTARAAP